MNIESSPFLNSDVVLVTGATGFTGVHLVKTLCDAGVKVRAIARKSSNRDELEHLPIDWIIGDVFDKETIDKAMDGVTVVFHVAAAYREASISDNVYWKVHVQSTQLLAQAALNQPNFRCFVHTSTIGVHGHIEQPPADENYRFSPGDQYQTTKVEAENWIRQFADENQLPVTVVRPAAIYGPGDRRLLKIFKMAKLPVCPLLGLKSKGLYHLIHVRDLVDFMCFVVGAEHTRGEIYICGSDEAISTRDMVTTIGKHLGKPPRFLKLPVTPFFLLGDICEFICKPFGIEPPIYRRRVAFFTKDRSFDTSKLREHAGFQCQYDNTRGLKELTDWYNNEGWL